MPSPDLARVDGIEPVEGWALFYGEDGERSCRSARYYVAVRGDVSRLLNVSSFFFTPTQERFAWIVRHDFPHGVVGACGSGPLDDCFIDEGLVADMLAASRDTVRDRVRRMERTVENVAAALVLVSGFSALALVARAVL